MFEIRRNDPILDFPLFTGDLGEFFNTPFKTSAKNSGRERTLRPALETYKRGDNFIVCAEVPGIDPKEVDISFEGDILSIKGRRETRPLEEGEERLMSEVTYGAFERHLRLTEDIDVEKIQATCKDGILQITLPVKESSKPRKIVIEDGDN